MRIPCELPVRLFNGWVAGTLAGSLFGFLILTSGHTPRAWADDEPPPAPPDDDDIRSNWETAYHLDLNNPADAGSDFDNDGLTALQVCETLM